MMLTILSLVVYALYHATVEALVDERTGVFLRGGVMGRGKRVAGAWGRR